MAWPFSLPADAATCLAQLTCHENRLPQGAPTSPLVSNMICARMDSQLQRLASGVKCSYSRYADDISFSTSKRDFPRALCHYELSGSKEEAVVGQQLRQVIESNGFSINYDKVRLQHRRLRQEVTGLTTNKFPNVSRRYTNRVRAMLHAWRKHGLEKAQAEYWEQYQGKHRATGRDGPPFADVVRGRIAFIGSVRGKEDAVYRRLAREFYILTDQLIPWDAMEVFFSYSHKDEALRDELEKHLALLKREGVISSWHDRKIDAGDEWEKKIDDHLDSSRIILLLISSDFIASEYCWGKELDRAMQRHNEESAVVIPVILRPGDWHTAPFAKLQAVPTDAKAISLWSNQDEALADVARHIRIIAKGLKDRSSSA